MPTMLVAMPPKADCSAMRRRPRRVRRRWECRELDVHEAAGLLAVSNARPAPGNQGRRRHMQWRNSPKLRAGEHQNHAGSDQVFAEQDGGDDGISGEEVGAEIRASTGS